ncbi:hypothetical protein GCM10020367_63940 [Streptomyces sannanensis]|uniref:RapZ C-terminal domain-containing protein n=1 Tax=Streptomyces sannanensis TaxID=285536 RepID=A0ABP6SMC9_9ACTN
MLRADGLDPHVRDYVLATPGADRLIERSFGRALALLALSDRDAWTYMCCAAVAGIESVVVAEELAARLRAVGYGVETEHRHIDRAILG